MIGRLQRVPLREVWPHEAQSFTRWLQENPDILSEVLNVTLTSIEREQAAGSFSADLVAEDEDGNPVIIENQLGKSDHDHLGKLITYVTAFDAKTGIWIVADPRPEHVNAIGWLNQSTSATFYLVKVEAVRVQAPGSDQVSPPAPLLTLIVGPDETSKEIGEKKKELADRDLVRRRFWSALLDKAKLRTNLHANISPSTDSWISTGAGRSGLSYNYNVQKHSARVDFYIDTGDAETNKAIFDVLHAARDEIEECFGGSLEWERLEARRASRISKTIDSGGYRDENWDETQDAMIDAMVRLETALRPHLQRLPR